MIVKYIANPKTQSNKATRIGSLLDYIEADGAQTHRRRSTLGRTETSIRTPSKGSVPRWLLLRWKRLAVKTPLIIGC